MIISNNAAVKEPATKVSLIPGKTPIDDIPVKDPIKAACPKPGDHKLAANVVAQLANTDEHNPALCACHVNIVATMVTTNLDFVCG